MEDKIKVYLADDHQMLIEGMKAVIKSNENFEVVGYSLNGVNLIEDVTISDADILIMDINMPKIDGIEVLKEYSRLKRPFKVIVLSSYDDLKLVREVMKLGARGYLTKQSAAESIIEALVEVTKGEEYFCKIMHEKILNSFVQNNQEWSQNKIVADINLTQRELVILKLIALEFSGKKIGEKLFISANTVETHRKNLLKKVNVKSSIGLAKYAIRNNLIDNLKGESDVID
ncbi:response regulator [Flavobacterium psychrotolerans]|uniref:DNA-binding response regulator n=1 Tax=Flavobacterium psychrotolerans TaxID=2169410 RepID=A0A2U1JQB6_9FLAO|nr:response regulator transcription factor [Flavobacterium psychrotolerans]PWA07376.1 DNA-binding response regulator [Flavobacterium psychrotolerans]